MTAEIIEVDNEQVLNLFVDEFLGRVEILELWNGRIKLVFTSYENYGVVDDVDTEEFDGAAVDRITIRTAGYQNSVVVKCSRRVSITSIEGILDVTALSVPDLSFQGGSEEDYLWACNCGEVDAAGGEDDDDLYVWNATYAVVRGDDGRDNITCGRNPYGTYDITPIGGTAVMTVFAETPGIYYAVGSEGSDRIYGIDEHGSSMMYFYGGGGDDELFGGRRCYNLLDGGDDDDCLYGGQRRDTLYGGAGQDDLIGCRAMNPSNYDWFGTTPVIDGDSDEFVGGHGADRFFGDFVSVQRKKITETRTRYVWDWKHRKLVAKTFKVETIRTGRIRVEAETIVDFRDADRDEVIETVLN